MKLNIQVGWFIVFLVLALVIGYMGSMGYNKMMYNKGPQVKPAEAGTEELPATEVA